MTGRVGASPMRIPPSGRHPTWARAARRGDRPDRATPVRRCPAPPSPSGSSNGCTNVAPVSADLATRPGLAVGRRPIEGDDRRTERLDQRALRRQRRRRVRARSPSSPASGPRTRRRRHGCPTTLRPRLAADRSGGISDSRLNAPRNLNAPARCCDSSLPNTVAPVRASSRSECRTGVTTASPAITSAAARMSAMSITRSASRACPAVYIEDPEPGLRSDALAGVTRARSASAAASRLRGASGPRAPHCPAVRVGRATTRRSSCSCVLADADRRIRPDRGETDIGGDVVGMCHDDVGDPVALGIADAELAGATVDVDRPHGCIGRSAGHRQRDGTGAATEVEQVALAERAGVGARSSIDVAVSR